MRATTLNLFDAAFLASAEAQAQAAVTPTSFGQPFRWYDASSLNYLTNGAFVSTGDPWDDKSPSDDDAFSTIGHEPTLQKNVINGNSTVRFVGAKRMLFEGGDLVLDAFTILCVALSASDSNYVSHSSFNRQIRINRLDEDRAGWFDGNSGSELISNQFLSNANQPRMIGHRRTDATDPAGRTFRFFDNATEITATTTNVDASLFGVDQIGTLGQHATPLNIDIAELIIYDTALTTVEIQAIYNGYFKPKFALP